MNIALFGYGKMGKMIEKIALKRNHNIVAKIDLDATDINFSEIDVAIDFSMPNAAYGNIKNCLDHNVPIISGTTGWLQDYPKAVALCKKNNGAFIYASNFSLGVNLFFELNSHLAKLMASQDQYRVSMKEIHHTQKLDAPSGTAITLAEGVIANTDYKGWKLDRAEDREIPITAKRIGDTPGTHTVSYESEVDGIEIIHTAHNREGFALGAVIAAEWIVGKTGVFTMKDVLNLS
ncbi:MULTISPECIES: 4-hydroxy-tetrahydrodipicolinate reductase [unclassified Arenibacter]|jgi:4-hydroxy-tetrahydrodipicolinate reductase|uniref:4-hydroxy-tetrahydrodipicolinate reductase n=1 Tax=unclassified Arenibacter TaxID=2615047 RepID=UPI000E34A887|nr:MULTISPECIES: 4-hydroxy-tetrahydrodipicolinate reductase [unclassified Arenibacter]MCM4165317.1 4-hydroxy-tetrahydrodipicolinate reductase [Arenibacter sp. A80]RFT55165.1 4-hydroxy-tetrahydrodipicolinate reductase [Arenibacter sp. P308M17]